MLVVVVVLLVALDVLLPVVLPEADDEEPLLVTVTVVAVEPEADAEEAEAEPDAVGLVVESIANWPDQFITLGAESDTISSA